MSNTKKGKPKYFDMIFAAVLIALIALMTFTGIGYIPVGPFKLTFLTLPVAVAAVFLGPAYGSILGFAFGMSSFLTCVFGMDPLGVVLLGINPVKTFAFCVIPRVLCGLIPALIFKLISKKDESKIIGSAVACTLTAGLNTVLFLSMLWILFSGDFLNNSSVIEALGGTVIQDITVLFTAFAGVNAIIEAAVALVFGTAICKALFEVEKRLF